MADGTAATVEGVLTTDLGALESARSGFVQDATAGIAIYLDAPFDIPVAAGSRIRATGSVDSRFGQRTLRVDRADVTVLGEQWLPTPLEVQTGAAAEPLEGLRLQLARDRHGGAERAERRAGPDDRRRLGRGAGDRRAGRAGWPRSGARVDRGRARPARPARQLGDRPRGVPPPRHARRRARGRCRRRRRPRRPRPTPSPSPSPTAEPTPTVGPTPTAAPSLSPAPSPSPSAAPSASPSASPPITIAAARLGPDRHDGVRARRGRRRGRQARHAAAPRDRRCDRRDPGQAARRRRGAGARHAARGPRRPRRPVRPGGAAPAERRHRRRRDRDATLGDRPERRRRRRAERGPPRPRERHDRRLGVQVDQQRPHLLHHRVGRCDAPDPRRRIGRARCRPVPEGGRGSA